MKYCSLLKHFFSLLQPATANQPTPMFSLAPMVGSPPTVMPPLMPPTPLLMPLYNTSGKLSWNLCLVFYTWLFFFWVLLNVFMFLHSLLLLFFYMFIFFVIFFFKIHISIIYFLLLPFIIVLSNHPWFFLHFPSSMTFHFSL